MIFKQAQTVARGRQTASRVKDAWHYLPVRNLLIVEAPDDVIVLSIVYLQASIVATRCYVGLTLHLASPMSFRQPFLTTWFLPNYRRYMRPHLVYIDVDCLFTLTRAQLFRHLHRSGAFLLQTDQSHFQLYKSNLFSISDADRRAFIESTSSSDVQTVFPHINIDLMDPNEVSLEGNSVRAYMSLKPNDRLGAIVDEVAKGAKRVSLEQECVSLPNVLQKATRVIKAMRQPSEGCCNSNPESPPSSPTLPPKAMMAATRKRGQKVEVAQPTQPTASHTTAERIFPEKDPTNLLILRLRDVDHLKWEEIASTLNNSLSCDDTPSKTDEKFTPENLYGRYVRATHRLAVLKEESATTELRTQRKVAKARKNGKTLDQEGLNSIWTSDLEVMLVEAVNETRAEFWENVVSRVLAKGGVRMHPADCERRYSSI